MSSRSYLGIRISRTLKRQLLAEAERTGLTLSQVVRERLNPYSDIK